MRLGTHLLVTIVAWVTVVLYLMRFGITGELHLLLVGSRMGRQGYPGALVCPIHHGDCGQAYLITPSLESTNQRGGLRELLISRAYSVARFVAIRLRANMTGRVTRSLFT